MEKKVLYGRTILTVVLLSGHLTLFAGPRFDRYDHASHHYSDGDGFAFIIVLIILAIMYIFRRN